MAFALSSSVRRARHSHCSLQLFAQELEDPIADEGADQGNEEVRGRDDVVQGKGEGLALAVDARELAHEQIGIKEEDDKRDFDQSLARAGLSRGGGVSGDMERC